ncbi:MAG: hypothetical protein ACLTSX_09840 [Collinsella sp.]
MPTALETLERLAEALRRARPLARHRVARLARHERAHGAVFRDAWAFPAITCAISIAMRMRSMRRHMPTRKIVVFSDSGHPGAWKRFMAGDQYQNVVMDLHLYHFRDETAQDITTPRGLTAAHAAQQGFDSPRRTSLKFPVIVGEWSGAAVLSGSSVTPEGRRAYERVFVSNQLATFDAADGWFFQTWKTERRLAAWDARVAACAPLERAMME